MAFSEDEEKQLRGILARVGQSEALEQKTDRRSDGSNWSWWTWFVIGLVFSLLMRW